MPEHQPQVDEVFDEAVRRAAGQDRARYLDEVCGGDLELRQRVERPINKFTDAAKEAGKSRIYAGIHWSFDVAVGEQMGRKVGQYVTDHYFQPLTGGSGGALVDAVAAHAPVIVSLPANQVQPLLAEALVRWQAAGVDPSALTLNGAATTSDKVHFARTGRLTFAPGETTKVITIEFKGDSKKEADETFYVDLFGNGLNSLITKNRGLGMILNDD